MQELLNRLSRIQSQMKATTPEGLLCWILNIVQTPPSARPSESVLLERIGVAAHYSRQAGIAFEDGKVSQPSSDQAAQIINRWTDMLRQAISRELVKVGEIKSEPILAWRGEQYREREATGDLLSLAVTTLKKLILEYGHLLKACDAPKPRSKEKCGQWFLASRVSQLYHSATCASRVSTQASRPKGKSKKKKT